MPAPLHNHDAERMLLSLLSAVSLTSVSEARAMLDAAPVSPTDFHRPQHAAYLEVALGLLRRGEPVTPLAVAEALKGR
ncbi:MAG: hypothetical protein L0Y66_24480, partial [Myxococcaceae bacterium]|nr:hypothetical protein [Myxococcaceae bacterium]